MQNKFRKIISSISVMLLAIPALLNSSTIISAQEEDYSFSSEETFNYEVQLSGAERRQLFNENWKFTYGDQSNGHLNTYDDSSWENIQIPHDYSLSQSYTQSGEAESGYKLGGVGWYRKSFTLDESAKDKRVVVEFGGVYMQSTVYINGHELGFHPYGYTPVAYDLTEHINYDGENVIAVRVDNPTPTSRWYSGSGIYRNVHMTITDKVHIDHYGVQVLAPNLENQLGSHVDVQVNTDISNESSENINAIVRQSIREKGSENSITSEVSDSIEIGANESISSNVALEINNPTLWSISNPHLYEIVTEVLVEDEVIDEYITDYGFRTFNFTSDTGFYLNGEAIKLKGVSMHHDQGSLGAAAHYRAMERQVEILQEMGTNAIRVTHNPAADEFIEIANRKGMLVIDEAFDGWVDSKNGNYNDYAVWFNESVGDNQLIGATSDMTWAEFDTKTMVRRGINAPSIISWSTGNEVMEGNSGPYTDYPDILEQLIEWVAEVDQTRPATLGENKLKANWGEAIDFAEILTENNAPIGFNYADGRDFDRFHENYPEWQIYGAETASSINSRGVYNPSNYDKHLTAYDESTVGWGKLSADSWHTVITRDFVAGEFVWTGFDYLGEPTPWNNVGPGATGGWPSPKSSYFGIIDTAGLPKDRYYFYQSQWNEAVDTLHILPTWEEDMVQIDEEGNVRVDVYSDARSVELFFRDQDGVEESLGKKTFTEYTTEAGHSYQVYEGDDSKEQDFRNLYLTWNVPYADGTVYAVGYDENDNVITNTVGRDSVTTFEEATELSLEADRDSIVANGRDLSYITIDVTDENGEIVADASNLMDVSVSGDGELIALDNGDQVDHEPYDSGKRKAFNGKLVAIVKSTTNAGAMTVNVESEGIASQSLTITTTPDPEASSEKTIVGYTLPNNYYVKLGYQPILASETTILFSDGTEETHPITWETEENMFDEPGTDNVFGLVEEYDLRVSTNVTVIESIGAILNYSLATSTGVDGVNLPSSRPLVLENGEVLDTEFQVEWEAQDPTNYEEPGLVTINGTSTVFGETIPVTASTRVDEAEVTLGDNIAGNNLTLTQDIPEEFQSDSLEAIVDGDTGFITVSEGPNDSVWTNYDMAQTGQNKAEIIFTYATAQYLGAADLYFYQDSWAARLPENVELYWSNEGTVDANWTKIENVEVEFGETSEGTPNTTKAEYRFNGVPAVGFKIVLTSDPGTNNNGDNLAVGLTEVELRVEQSSLVVNTEATLDNLLLNGNSVTASELNNKVVNTEYQRAEVETESDSNVAVTILEPFENVIRIITESEDHSARETYTINLSQPASDGELPADNAERDYPYEKTTATAGDYHKDYPTEGDPNFAVDNRLETIFHTPWGGTDPDNFWITLELEEVTKLDALRYLSRSGQTNGIVNEYTVEVSLDNETWEEVATGQWGSQVDTWSIANFNEPKEAKFVRLTALSTYGDGAQANRFMTAKEIRLREPLPEKDSIEAAQVTLDQKVFSYDGEAKEPNVTVSLESEVLEEGIDYRVVYEDNVETGEAKVVIVGIVNYQGSIEVPFTILDLTELESLISEVNTLDLEMYTEDSVSALNIALETAIEALENPETQLQINEAFANLEDALNNLEEKPEELNIEALVEKLAEAKEIDTADYSEVAVKFLNTAIEAAEDALENAKTQAEIDEALANLENAIDDLNREPEEILRDALIARIAEANALDLEAYTEDTVLALREALAAAEEILENAETQLELEEALANIETAIRDLEEKPEELAKEALTNRLAEVAALDLENYTAESVQALNAMIEAAERALVNATTQEELDEALANLETAISDLEEKPEELAKEALTNRLAEVAALDLENYTAESVHALSIAIEAAQEALGSATTQEELDEALANLETAISELEEKPEDLAKEALMNRLAEVETLDLESYTTESVQALNAMIEAAEEVLVSATTQAELDEALANLETAISELEEKPEDLNKEALRNKLSEIASLDLDIYTTESVQALNNMVEAAEKTLMNATTQAELDEALINLEAVVANLKQAPVEEPEDELIKGLLSEKLAEAKALNTEIFTADSVKSLNTAIKEAEDALTNATTQEEVDQALEMLEEAINALEVIVDSDNVGNSNTETDKNDSESLEDKEKELLNAGESSSYGIIALGIALIIAGGVMYVVNKRKNKI